VAAITKLLGLKFGAGGLFSVKKRKVLFNNSKNC